MSIILGVGTDLVHIERIEATYKKFGRRFLNRIYTEKEIESCLKRKEPIYRFAQRWAAKEACSKALGTGLRQGVYWRDMEVIHKISGQPTMQLTGGALKRAMFLCPKDHHLKIDLSLTDEYPLAHGIVIISAISPNLSKELNL